MLLVLMLAAFCINVLLLQMKHVYVILKAPQEVFFFMYDIDY